MKRMTKVVAMICSVALLMGLIPTAVFAADDPSSGSADGSVVSLTDSYSADEILTLDNLTEEDILGEVETLREESAKHFMLSDGTMVAVTYPHAVHEKVDEEWVEIDNTLSSATDSDGDSVQQTASQNVKFSFVNGKGNGRLVKVEDTTSKAQVIFELENANKKDIVLSEMEESDELFAVPNIVQKGTYVNILDDTDIEYIIAGTTLKENIIVKNANAMGAVSFVLRCKNATATLQENNSVIFQDSNGDTVFTIPAPFMYDAAGVCSDSVAVTLEEHQKGYLYTVTPNEAWTQDEARVYPITIDPVVTTNANLSSMRDAVWEKTATGVQFPSSYLPVGSYGGFEVGALLYMDIPESITDSARIINASVNLSAFMFTANPTTTQINAYQYGEAWDMTQAFVTQTEEPTVVGNALDYVLLDEQANSTRVEFDITEAANRWITDHENYGILLRAQNTPDCFVFAGQDMGSALVPAFAYHYCDTKGIEEYWTYTTVPGGFDGSIAVNNYSGNLVYEQPIITPDETNSLELTWTYNANESAAGWYANIGVGAFTNYHIRIEKEEDDSPLKQIYPYYLIDADGTKHSFIEKPLEDEEESSENTEIQYVDEDNVGYTLTLDDNEDDMIAYRVEDAYGRTMTFDYAGRLMTITEADGETVVSVRTNTSSSGFLITSITDGETTISFHNEIVLQRNRVDYIQVGEDIYDLVYDEQNKFYLTKILYPDGKEVELIYEAVTDKVKRLVKVQTNQDEFNTTVSYCSVAQNNDQLLFARVQELCYNHNETMALRYGFTYGNACTNIEDASGRTATFQFDHYGRTVGVVDQEMRRGQYYEYGAYAGVTAESLSQANQLLKTSATMQSNTNLIDNPHMMEMDSNPWSFYTETTSSVGQYQWRTDRGHSDNTSALMTQIGGAPTGCWLRQTVSDLEEGFYTASAYVTTNGETLSDNGAVLKVEILDETNTVLRTITSEAVSNTAVDEWERVFASFRLANDETARICIGMANANGGFWVDDVSLEVGEVAGSYNMLLNSDFDAVSAWDGTYAISDHTAYMTGSTSATAKLSQTVAINAAAFKELSFGAWAKAASASTQTIDVSTSYGKVGQPTFALEISFLDANHAQIADSAVTLSYNDGVEDWQLLCGGASIPETAAYATFSVYYDYNLGSVYVDDAFVYLSSFATYDATKEVEDEEDSSEEEPYDYTSDSLWYSYLSAETEDGEMTTSQTISGEVATTLTDDTKYYIINAATGEALYAPTASAGAQVYLRPLAANDSGYVWTLDRTYAHQFCKTENGTTYDIAFSTEGYAVLKDHAASRHQAFAVESQGNGSFVLASGASYSEKNLDIDYDIDTGDDELTAVVHTTEDTESEDQKWLFVPYTNNAYMQIQTTYDADGNTVAETDELGNTVTYTYDADGNKLTQTDANGVTVSYTYDADGRLTSMQSSGSQVNYEYTDDALSTISKDNVPSGSDGDVVYSFVNDVLGRPQQVTVGNGSASQTLAAYTYNDRHQTESVTYGNGFVQSYVYDALDALTSVKNNGEIAVSFVYDQNGQPAVIKDYGNNRRTRLVYDEVGNVTRVLVTNGAEEDGGTKLLVKDYVTSDTTSGYTASVGGTTVSQTVATDAYGQADGVLLNGEEIVSYTFDDFGRLTSRQLNTDTPYNATMTFYPVSDEASTSHRVHTLNNGRETYSYAYDGNGNITSIGSGIVLRSYEYDSLGQMTVEHDRYTNSTTLYTYDNGGNLLQKAVYPDFYGANGTPTITTYAYDNSAWADQLTNYNGTAITYDNSGNPLNWRNGLSFTWQNGRQLASAANASNEVTYTYNQNGIRTSKTVNGVKTTYVLDENDQLMGEITGNNTTVFLYDENGTAYGFLYNNTPYFYLFNGQGDVVNVVDETGAVVATYNYDAWGNIISATGTMATINPIRYRGYYYDAETELYYLQSRYYDTTVGRFLNADDVAYLGASGTLLGHSIFTYCENNPVNRIDIDGHSWINLRELKANVFASWAKRLAQIWTDGYERKIINISNGALTLYASLSVAKSSWKLKTVSISSSAITVSGRGFSTALGRDRMIYKVGTEIGKVTVECSVFIGTTGYGLGISFISPIYNRNNKRLGYVSFNIVEEVHYLTLAAVAVTVVGACVVVPALAPIAKQVASSFATVFSPTRMLAGMKAIYMVINSVMQSQATPMMGRPAMSGGW